MKKSLITIVLIFGMITLSYSNTIDIKLDIYEQEIHNLNFYSPSISTNNSPGLASVIAQISYCAQVQMDVKETYTGIFGPDRANSIALGAFMGCMGML
jgi:hypothetical protein